jgi:hypothetical protein
MKYGLDCAYGGTSHFGKRCLIFTRSSTANGGRNKTTKLSLLVVFLALKGRQSKGFFLTRLIIAYSCFYLWPCPPTNSFFFQVNGLCNI